MQKKVTIVDDHPVCRAGMKALLNSDERLQVVGEASGYRDGREVFQRTNPDIMIIDLSLADGSGLQLIKAIRAEDKQVRMLVASMHDDHLFAERALRQGANGYINKAQAADKILEAIQTLLKGNVYLCPDVANQILQRQLQGNTKDACDPVDLLSARELEVFTRIGQGLSSKKIANQLNVSQKTVDSHREHIKRKLVIDDSSELIQLAVAWKLTSMIEDVAE